MAVLKANPNATVAGATSGLAVLLVWLLSLFGVTIAPEVAAAITGVLATLVLLIGREGVRGIARIVWRGQG